MRVMHEDYFNFGRAKRYSPHLSVCVATRRLFMARMRKHVFVPLDNVYIASPNGQMLAFQEDMVPLLGLTVLCSATNYQCTIAAVHNQRMRYLVFFRMNVPFLLCIGNAINAVKFSGGFA